MGADLRVAARVRQWFSGLGFKQMWQLVVVVVLAATALFGGLEDADTEVTRFEPGEEFSDGQFTLAVARASLVDEIMVGTRVVVPDNPGRKYLGLVVWIRNDGSVPGNLLDEFDIVGHPGQRLAGVFRMADSTYSARLGPGLDDEMAFVWELPDNAVVPGESVTLRVWKKKYTELMVTYGQAWVDSVTDYGEITVPVGIRS